MNKKILITILIVIVLAILGTIVFSQINSASDTQINFLNQATVNSGDNVTFQLTDAQGNALANKNLNIKYVKDGQTQNFTVVSDSEGKGYLALTGEEPGLCEVTVSFDGDDKYNPSNATQTVTINETTSESTAQDNYQDSSASTQASTSDSTSDSSSSANYNYDSELNVYYDNDGVIRGGQNDGESYNDIKNNPPQVEDGNLE